MRPIVDLELIGVYVELATLVLHFVINHATPARLIGWWVVWVCGIVMWAIFIWCRVKRAESGSIYTIGFLRNTGLPVIDRWQWIIIIVVYGMLFMLVINKY